jgi:hypothetical protein
LWTRVARQVRFETAPRPTLLNMTSFNITSASAFLAKFQEEQADFHASHCLSARHALNAIITAYHLHEWVWDECRHRAELLKKWGLKANGGAKNFKVYLSQFCPALDDARKVANGTKHFRPNKIDTGAHHGGFQRNVFQSDAFDVSYLWIERDGDQQRAEDFIKELAEFWRRFFEENEL